MRGVRRGEGEGEGRGGGGEGKGERGEGEGRGGEEGGEGDGGEEQALNSFIQYQGCYVVGQQLEHISPKAGGGGGGAHAPYDTCQRC